jgi:hypothetical protein
MWARRVVYQMMVISPFGLLAYIGLFARFSDDPFTFSEYGPEVHGRILAYTPFVAETNERLSRNAMPPSNHAREIATKWLKGREEEVLKSLPPISAEDSVREGIKNQAFDSKIRVLGHLNALAYGSMQAGDQAQAVEDGLLALELAEVLKYSDFLAVSLCSMEQRRVLGTLRRLDLSPELGRELRERLASLKGRQQSLDRLASLVRRNHAERRMREGREPLSIEETRRMVAVRYMLSHDAPPQVVLTELKSSLLASTGEEAQFFSEVRLGVSAQQALIENLDEFIQAIDSRIESPANR